MAGARQVRVDVADCGHTSSGRYKARHSGLRAELKYSFQRMYQPGRWSVQAHRVQEDCGIHLGSLGTLPGVAKGIDLFLVLLREIANARRLE